jgi:hypothetical protein
MIGLMNALNSFVEMNVNKTFLFNKLIHKSLVKYSQFFLFFILFNHCINGKDKVVQAWDTLPQGKYEPFAVSMIAKLYFDGEIVAYHEKRQLTEQQFKKDKSRLGELTLLNFDGIRYNNEGNQDSAKNCFIQAIDLAIELNDSLNFAANSIMLGNIHYMNAEYLKAIELWKKTLNFYNIERDSIWIGSGYSNIASAYLQLGYYQNSFSSFENALKYFPENSKTQENYWITKANMGVAVNKMGGPDQALSILNSIPVLQHNDHVRLIVYLNKANIHNIKENFDSFYHYIDSCELYIKSRSQYTYNYKNMKLEGLINSGNAKAAGELLEELKSDMLNDLVNPVISLSLYKAYAELTGIVLFDIDRLNEIEKAFLVNNNNNGLVDIYSLKSIHYKKENQFANALKYANLKDSLKDLIHQEELKTRFLDYAEKYQNVLITKENIALKDDIVFTKTSLKRSKIFIFILTLSGILLVTLLTLTILNFNKTKRINKFEKSLLDKEKKIKELELTELKNKYIEQEKELNQTVAMLINVRQLENNLMNLLNNINNAEDLRQVKKITNTQQIELKKFKEEHNSYLIEQTLRQKLKDFTDKLEKYFSEISEKEKLIAGLIRSGFSTKDIANMLNRSEKNIENYRTSLRKKMGLTQETVLNEFLKSI